MESNETVTEVIPEAVVEKNGSKMNTVKASEEIAPLK